MDWVEEANKDDHALWCALTAQPQAEDRKTSVNSKLTVCMRHFRWSLLYLFYIALIYLYILLIVVPDQSDYQTSPSSNSLDPNTHTASKSAYNNIILSTRLVDNVQFNTHLKIFLGLPVTNSTSGNSQSELQMCTEEFNPSSTSNHKSSICSTTSKNEL